MSIYQLRTEHLRDGTTIDLRSPIVKEAEDLLHYLDTVRWETENIMYSPNDRLPDVEAEEKWIERHQEETGALLIGAYAEDRLVGLAGINQRSFKKQKHVANIGISIKQAWWGRGLGTILMNALIDWSRQHKGIEKVTLTVFADNAAALRLYEKFGFEEEGRFEKHARRMTGLYVDVIQLSLWVKSDLHAESN